MPEKLIPPYRGPDSDSQPADRWSTPAILTLPLSIVASPIAMGQILDRRPLGPLDGRTEFAIAVIAAILSFAISLPITIHIGRVTHIRGMRFALPAMMTSFLSCAFYLLISVLGGPE